MIARIFYFIMAAVCILGWIIHPDSLALEVGVFGFLVMLRLEDMREK